MTGAKPARDEGIDIARALLVLAMVLWHATDAWSDAALRKSGWHAAIALVGSTALPGFLLLAGVGIGLAVDAAARRGKKASEVRAGLVKRGLMLVAAGYAFNVAMAIVDGAPSIESALRADVLHGIGLSMVLVALVHVRDRDATIASESGATPRGDGASPWSSPTVALAVGALAIAPFVALVTRDTTGPLAPLVALFAYVPGLSRAPLVPLVALMALGVVLARFASGMQRSPALLVVVGLACVASSMAFRLACDATVVWLGGALTPAHPAVIANALDGASRACLVIALGGLLAQVPRAWARAPFVRVGRSSLFAYVVHIPFCYGRLGSPLAHQLPLAAAVAAACVLFALVVGAVALKDAIGARRARVEPAPER